MPRETGNNAYAKFGGTDKDYYGVFQSGLWETYVEEQVELQ